MKHLGDITKIRGCAIQPVDVAVGGSPCQDLSIAGKREGLAGERSGLYMEQIRIIKELRYADRLRGRTAQSIRPRFMLWENVPGAFSSNEAEDFRAVLEEAARVADQGTVIPGPPNGRWATSGAILGDGWSIAWRVLDAQFWGVPQRRRRIALVADFGGHAAPEVLFVRKSVSGDTDQGEAEREGFTAGTGGGFGGTSAYRIGAYYSAGMLSNNPKAGIIRTDMSCTLDCNGGNPTSQQGGVCVVQPPEHLDASGFGETGAGYWQPGIQTLRAEGENRPSRPSNVIVNQGALIQEERSGTLGCNNDQTLFCLNDQGGNIMGISEEVCGTLRAEAHGNNPIVAGFMGGQGAKAGSIAYTEELSPTLRSADSGSNRAPCVFENHGQDSRITGPLEVAPTVATKFGTGGNNTPLVMGFKSFGQYAPCETGKSLLSSDDVITGDLCIHTGRVGNTVRRLTPLECERLQGYPDGWTDIGPWVDSKGKLHKESSDSARYRALGNSIALPPWRWVMMRISALYERPATLGSFFDGIGGFPLVWERLNGPGSCLWASEIEEFPIAVTKYHFEEAQP